MNEIDFWKKDAACMAAMIDSIDHLTKDSYLWVMDLQTNITWCSRETKEYFALDSQISPEFTQSLLDLVHPYDRNEYLEGVEARVRGEHVGEELCIRIRGTGGSFYMFSFHTDMIKDETGTCTHLIVVMKNENVLPEIDALTDLYSFARYSKDLELNIAGGGKLAILKIGVVGFNNFGMIYGANFANEILQQMALEFIYMMDADKAVYRLDGEQFVFIMRRAGRRELIAFEQQLRGALDAGIVVTGKLVSIKISAGAILLDDYEGDVSAIHSKVSYALTHSADKHQGQLIIFNDEVQTSHGVNLELMKIIHQSVREGCKGFYVEYQPVVDSTTGSVVGAEALVRWKQEPYGRVPPGMFIEWMETDPSMYDLGNYVLKTALTEAKRILPLLPNFFLNVNVSARQLERPEFHQAVLDILKETGFPSDHLCMELTERCKDFPLDVLREEVAFFQSYGIRVAMDDYGTGSASSSIVMNIPMDEIKIDMSFIRGIVDNPKNQAMVRAILDFANKAGMTTCLEGVENEELESYLRSYNATWFQGYLYAKPLPIEQLEDMLTESALL
ncbi:MAG: sensor domain-containing phosphodiesterase [Muribaculaceae bacterium]|nr:sensor domain-containing phosphodiesterase [Roseburia sp.]MCM1431491.1 sensor domain-containing phosphodiesterase [Muribaculaceae bacterium]MCM1493215.1 sensor domain-containing phosphodiesterase [Muribaculaceae bacterium]